MTETAVPEKELHVTVALDADNYSRDEVRELIQKTVSSAYRAGYLDALADRLIPTTRTSQ